MYVFAAAFRSNADLETKILVAFVTQSLVAVVVSFYTFILSLIIEQRWDAADPNRPAEEANTSRWPRTNFGPTWFFEVFLTKTRISTALDDHVDVVTFKPQLFYIPQSLLRRMAWLVGEQPRTPRVRTAESKIDDEVTPTTKRLDLANRILLAGSDSQTFTGIIFLL